MTAPFTRLALVAALAWAFAACGGDDEQPAAGASPTVSVEQVDGVGSVLVDRTGAALYTSEQEADGEVRCTGPCASIWVPVVAGGEPTAGDGVDGDLATVERPDGSTQLTYDGAPLYRFAEDTERGDVTGDGLSDDFAGQTFTWHAATADGGSSSSSDDGGGGSYGY